MYQPNGQSVRARRPAPAARTRQITPPVTKLPTTTPSAIRKSLLRRHSVTGSLGTAESGSITVDADGAARSDPRAGGSLAGNDSRLA
jgi:hypothetical protein